MKRIGVLTGGGDAAGMNTALRAVVRTACGLGAEVGHAPRTLVSMRVAYSLKIMPCIDIPTMLANSTRLIQPPYYSLERGLVLGRADSAVYTCALSRGEVFQRTNHGCYLLPSQQCLLKHRYPPATPPA